MLRVNLQAHKLQPFELGCVYIQFDFYNQRDLEDIKKKIRKNTKVLYIESPGTYTFEIIDIKKVVKIAKDKKIRDDTIQWSTNSAIAFEKVMIDIFQNFINKNGKISTSK